MSAEPFQDRLQARRRIEAGLTALHEGAILYRNLWGQALP